MPPFPHRLRTILSAASAAGALVLALPAVSSAEVVDAPGAAAPAVAPPSTRYVTPTYHLTLGPAAQRATAAPAKVKVTRRRAAKAKRVVSRVR